MSKKRRWLLRTAIAVPLLLLVAGLGAWLALRSSLPTYHGTLVLPGLSATTRVERDDHGVVTIAASTRIDAVRALGFVHAQERFFEMDLMRRVGAGELAELFGAGALQIDRKNRPHRFRTRAQAVIEAADSSQQLVMQAYVDGVNAGLGALAVRPFPYLLLRQQPRAWTAADSVLVIHAMFFDLNDEDNAQELALHELRRRAPESLYAFLTAAGTRWDAALGADTITDPELPPASDVDLRPLPAARFGLDAKVGGDLGIGSNNFAVGGALTANGAALVANDMHLGLRVPNIWFRARLRYAREGADAVDVSGVTLPGVPGVVVGSNRHVAWAFTNSYGDWLDWVQVQWTDPDTRSQYRTPEGEATVVEHLESIVIAGAAAQQLQVRETIWGPIAHESPDNGSLALSWTAHHARSVNLVLAELETARTVDEALDVAHRAGTPPQNFVVGDRDGHIAWTIIGAIPARGTANGTQPADWSESGAGWQGWLPPEQYPQVRDPADHRLWSANARVASGPMQALIGNGGYALGARAQQIRDGLRARKRFAPANMLAIQLDDRSVFLRPWWQLLRAALATAPADPELAELDRLTRDWDERAIPEAVAYRLVRAFRIAVSARVLDGLAAPLRDDAHADYRLPALQQSEGIVWKLLHERPEHLLPPIFDSWDGLLLAGARTVVTQLGSQPGGLAARTWGERNSTAIRHPLSRAITGLSWLLDMPSAQLPGDTAMPRVQGPSFGASERLAVSPGDEEHGYLHMPGGQSGHPLSAYYGAGHHDWEDGAPTPFLPGAAQTVLLLTPGSTP